MLLYDESEVRTYADITSESCEKDCTKVRVYHGRCVLDCCPSFVEHLPLLDVFVTIDPTAKRNPEILRI